MTVPRHDRRVLQRPGRYGRVHNMVQLALVQRLQRTSMGADGPRFAEQAPVAESCSLRSAPCYVDCG